MNTQVRRNNLHQERKSVQDYLVVPQQLWLDGFASVSGEVSQFVAMPAGSGYSVEAQLKGDDTTAGLHFEITPSRPQGSSGSLKTFIRTPTGKLLTLNVSQGDTISNLKHLIHAKEGIPCDEQRLLYAGCQLQDYRMLSECGISEVS